MALKLLTTNVHKAAEFSRIGLPAEVCKALPYAEAGEPKQVAAHKALALPEGIVVEVTSLTVEGFRVNAPIPEVLKAVRSAAAGTKGVKEPKAVWLSAVAYHAEGVLYTAQAQLSGRLLSASISPSEGFDGSFVPDGLGWTLAMLEREGLKDTLSPRKDAVRRLLEGKAGKTDLSSVPFVSRQYRPAKDFVVA